MVRRSETPFRKRSSPLFGLAATIIVSLLTKVDGALYEPAGNQVLLGAWVDTAGPYYDTPVIFNRKIKQLVPVFQIAQPIPLPPFNYVTGAGGAAPENLIERSGTDAAVFLTVYPEQGFAAAGEADFTALANQILFYQANLNRTVFLRYAPEMQGLWNVYGFRPIEFLASWTLMYSTIKTIAPNTIIVWAPNTPQGYPYGQTINSVSPPISAANLAAMDTNGDGVITSADDAFSPWYPGDAMVDWNGLSVYYKGPNGAAVNVPQTPGYCAGVISGLDPGTGAATTNFYTTYCANKPSKACMFAESGAAYRPTILFGSTATAIHQAWIADCYGTTFLDQFPRIKLIMQFEYEKEELANEGGMIMNDYRLTNNSAVLNAFVADLGAEATRFSWANSRAIPTSISTPGAPPAPTTITVTNPAYSAPGSGDPVTVIDGTTLTLSTPLAITATTRVRSTNFPRLFGATSDATSRALIELAAIVMSGVIGAGVVMKWL